MLSNYSEYFKFIGEYASQSSAIDSLAEKKAQAISDAIFNQDVNPQTVLSLGFGLIPIGLINKGYNVTIGHCSTSCKKYGEHIGILDSMTDKTLPDFVAQEEQFDVVIAADDFMTYFETEEEQQIACRQLVKLAKKLVILTCRDYKNLPVYHRQFDEPLVFSYIEDKDVIMFQRRKWSRYEKQTWQNYMYAITDERTDILGPTTRRTIYFKQLAKYMHDCEISSFYIEKNLLYKPLFAKHYEHIICIKP